VSKRVSCPFECRTQHEGRASPGVPYTTVLLATRSLLIQAEVSATPRSAPTPSASQAHHPIQTAGLFGSKSFSKS